MLGPVTRLSKLSTAVAASGTLGIFLGIAFKMGVASHFSFSLCGHPHSSSSLRPAGPLLLLVA